MTEGRYEVAVMVRITTEQAAKLDMLADALGGKRSEAIRAFIDALGVDEVTDRESKRLRTYTQPAAPREMIVAA